MHIYLKNVPANFHPHPIRNGLDIFEQDAPSTEEQEAQQDE